MSPRSSDSNASSTNQKKKIQSLSSGSLDFPPTSLDSSSASPSHPTPPPHQVPPPASAPLEQHLPPASLVSDASNPRVFVAATPKPISAIDAVTSTISALSSHANRGISTLIAAHSAAPNSASPLVTASADRSTLLRSDGSVSPIYDAFHNAGSPPDPARIEAALNHAHHSQHAVHAPLPRVLWSRWDTISLNPHPLKCAPLLISYFDDGTLQALLVQDRHISELLCLPNAADTLLDTATSTSASPSRAQLLTALVRHPLEHNTHPQLLLVLHEPNSATQLLAYSLLAHHVQASVQLQHHSVSLPDAPERSHSDDPRTHLWPQVESQCNERFLVLSLASPPSIHVLSTSTLQYLYPPILDVSAASPQRPSPISLSHRLLAFTCTASHDPSNIRSAARNVSSASYHDPSRPFAAVQADTSARVGEMRDNLFDTSAHVGDTARRIRGGVMSGVRTLGEWGSSYWPHAGSPPTTAAFSPSQPSLLSQSAPHTAHSSRPPSSASSSPMLLAADGGRASTRLPTGAPPSASIKPDITAATPNRANAVQAGCICVVDLGSDAHPVCTFAPSSNAVVLVSFSPCGRLLLTADTLGHAFHVFELPLSGTFANAANASLSTVHHRYKLMRGITTADAVHAEWSLDAQWIAVGTRSGTVHIYAINPFGGVPLITNHVQGKVRDPQVLQPFGVSLASLARSTRPSQIPQQDSLTKPVSAAGPETGPAATANTQIKIAPPSFLLLCGTMRGSDSDTDAHTPFELLTNDPRGVNVTLHALRCWSTQTRLPSTSTGSEDAHATSPESKQRFASASLPRSSGLSQMMRKAGEGLIHSQQAPRLQAECVRIAMWDQLAPESGALTKHNLSALLDRVGPSRPIDRADVALMKPLASVAEAEIETYSQSPAILPSSIFLSRQIFFHARTRNSMPSFSQPGSAELMRSIQRRGSRPIQVRRTARMVSREPSSDDPSSFDDSLAGALDQMSFDPQSLPPRSASAHIPSFPQGQRGRSSGWTTGSSIPIRIVAGGLGGIYRAGKELGRGVEMARRRTSGASGTPVPDGPATTIASISFDGVDDVDLLGEDEDMGRSGRSHYRTNKGNRSHVDHGSMRSDTSLLSVLRNDEPSRGSQSSLAETPSTRYSEAEDRVTDGLDADEEECDWDDIVASRSPGAPEALLFDVMHRGHSRRQKRQELEQVSVDDDFTVGMLDEDSGGATTTQSRASLSPTQGISSKANTPKELVYALPAGGSTRSSLLSQSSGFASTIESRVEVKAGQPTARDSSPTNSDGGESGSQNSGGSGLLCEGSKETHTIDSSPVSISAELEELSEHSVDRILDSTRTTKVTTTSSGGKKKKKRSGR